MSSDQLSGLAHPVPDASGTLAPPVRIARVPETDWTRLSWLPWGVPLDEWPEHGVQPLIMRRGESRHPVLFIESGARRYAVKETSPTSAEHEITAFEELRREGAARLNLLVTSSYPARRSLWASLPDTLYTSQVMSVIV